MIATRKGREMSPIDDRTPIVYDCEYLQGRRAAEWGLVTTA